MSLMCATTHVSDVCHQSPLQCPSPPCFLSRAVLLFPYCSLHLPLLLSSAYTIAVGSGNWWHLWQALVKAAVGLCENSSHRAGRMWRGLAVCHSDRVSSPALNCKSCQNMHLEYQMKMHYSLRSASILHGSLSGVH